MYRLFLLSALLTSAPVLALEVFVSKGAHGETSFSDTAPAGGATRIIEVDAPRPSQPPADAQTNAQEMWAFALEMEKSRLAREAARTERRRQLRPPPQQVVVREPEPRYVVAWPYRPYRPHKPRPPLRPPLRPQPRAAQGRPMLTPASVSSSRATPWR